MAAVDELCKEMTKVREDVLLEEVTVAIAISSPGKRRKVDENLTENLHVPAPEGTAVLNDDTTKTAVEVEVTSSSSLCDGEKDHERSSMVNLKEECATEIRTVDIRDAQMKSAPSKLSSPEIMESPSSANTKKKPAPTEAPSAAELEEFFAVAEKLEQKRFMEKYNFDIAMDVPLEGRYQWIHLKP